MYVCVCVKIKIKIEKKINKFFSVIKMSSFYKNRKFQKSYKASAPYSRMVYKYTGMKNPIKKGNLSISRLAKDVKIMKDMINSEKKRLDTPVINGSVGQVDGNITGFWISEITPFPASGAAYNGRTGSSIKLHSGILQMQFQAMDNVQNDLKIRIVLLKVDTDSSLQSAFDAFTDAFDPNVFVGTGSDIRDSFSLRNPDTFTKYRAILDRKYTIPADYHAGEKMIKDIVIPLKFPNWHIKFNGNSSTVAESGRIIMCVMADTGNRNPTTTSTISNVRTVGVSTGASFSCASRFFYYDN